MRAISLHQPWASLLFLNFPDGTPVKQDETRTWPTQVRGRVLIHAAHKIDREGISLAMDFIDKFGLPLTEFPFGCFVGSIILEDCRPAEQITRIRTAPQRLWGDYSAGRWAWIMREAVKFPDPINAPGRQRWFEADVGLRRVK